MRAARCAQDRRVRSIRCCLFRAGITRDPGPHLGDCGAVEGGDGATGAPPPPPRPDTDPGPGCRRDQGARAALPPAEPRDQGAERRPALPWGGVEVPPPRTPSADREGDVRAWFTAAVSGRQSERAEAARWKQAPGPRSRKPPST